MRLVIATFSLLLGLSAAPASAQPAQAPQTPPSSQVPTTIPEMWNAWCARCHGKDGKGNVSEPTVTVVPRDFTDCKTSTGEGDPDWELAITKGGPAVGLSTEMPAFGDALKPDVIRGFVEHLRKFCGQRGWPDGNLNLPRPIFTEKAFPEDELVIAPVASHRKGQPTEWRIDTIFEHRLGKRFQLELVGPLASVGANGRRQTGYADTEVGLKTVLNPDTRNHLATFGFDVVLPTGNDARGLSEGAGFEPYLATASAWGTTYLQTQFKLELPKNGPWLNKLAVYRVYLGRDLNLSPRGWTIGAEFTGENRAVAITPQFRKGLTPTGAIAAGFGVSLPLNKRNEQGVAWVGFLLWEYLEKPYFRR
jgi:mono/diheme cytochrome c family protein